MASGGTDDLEEIQEESGARVHFTDRDMATAKGKEERSVMIRGSPEAAQKAELMIHEIIADIPDIITQEIEVPGYCIGRIIGRGGENIRAISRTSKCKVFIDKTADVERGSHAPRIITISGSEKQIQLAKGLLEEKVREEEDFRAKTAVSAGNREPRKAVKRHAEDGLEKSSLPSKVVEAEGDWDSGDVSQPTVASTELVREFMEVFVSAVEHPAHFWLQIINTDSLGLDKLVDDMTALYSNTSSAQEYRVAEVTEGQIVAAPFDQDNSWYRARVLGFVNGKVDLYYIDFGDSGLVDRELIRQLIPEYLSLPEQAIECKLAGIKPAESEWSEEACSAFEDLTHCAEWKVLSAHTVGYELGEAGRQFPCVRLVDYADPQQPLDIAATLVARGLALLDNSQPSATAAAMETVRPDLQPQPDPKT